MDGLAVTCYVAAVRVTGPATGMGGRVVLLAPSQPLIFQADCASVEQALLYCIACFSAVVLRLHGEDGKGLQVHGRCWGRTHGSGLGGQWRASVVYMACLARHVLSLLSCLVLLHLFLVR